MSPECSIWIREEDKEKILQKMEENNEEEALYEGHKIDELYVDRYDGSLTGFIEVGDIGVSVWIPFVEWITQFIKFNTFEEIEEQVKKHQTEIKKIQENIKEIKQVLEVS